MERLKFNKLNVIYIFIFFSILTPPIQLSKLPSIRLEQLIIIAYSLHLILKTFKHKKVLIPKNKFTIIYFGFIFIILSSILNGYLNGYNVVLNDFFEIYKIYIYSFTFILMINNVKGRLTKIHILNMINICIFVSALIAITQYFNLFNLNEVYIQHIAPTQYITLVNDYPNPRVVGITGNPNVYGALLTMGLIVSLALLLSTKNKYNLFISLIEFIALLMTSSRTSFIFILISIFCFIILYYKNILIKKNEGKLKMILKVLLVLIIFIVFIILILQLLPNDLVWRMKSLLDITNQRSWKMRIDKWGQMISSILENPILGIGPGKGLKIKISADNEWLLLLRRYGIVGTLYFVSMFTLPLFNRKRNFTESMEVKIYISLCIGIAIYMIPAAFYHSFQLMSIFMILLSLIYKPNIFSGERKNEEYKENYDEY